MITASFIKKDEKARESEGKLTLIFDGLISSPSLYDGLMRHYQNHEWVHRMMLKANFNKIDMVLISYRLVFA